ncbi:hypothetical protein DRN74_07170 [Candidatus Micrarchaeota archaeon]|nr:MAG: hypothetical protein DRN74_07170 [Candidatus Micrarchaeota archaeon]
MHRLELVVLHVSALAGLSFALPPYPLPAIEAVVINVGDGDTIDVLIESMPDDLAAELAVGSEVRVRYVGVDVPEPDTAEGRLVTELNAMLVVAASLGWSLGVGKQLQDYLGLELRRELPSL